MGADQLRAHAEAVDRGTLAQDALNQVFIELVRGQDGHVPEPGFIEHGRYDSAMHNARIALVLFGNGMLDNHFAVVGGVKFEFESIGIFDSADEAMAGIGLAGGQCWLLRRGMRQLYSRQLAISAPRRL